RRRTVPGLPRHLDRPLGRAADDVPQVDGQVGVRLPLGRAGLVRGRAREADDLDVVDVVGGRKLLGPGRPVDGVRDGVRARVVVLVAVPIRRVKGTDDERGRAGVTGDAGGRRLSVAPVDVDRVVGRVHVGDPFGVVGRGVRGAGHLERADVHPVL